MSEDTTQIHYITLITNKGISNFESFVSLWEKVEGEPSKETRVQVMTNEQVSIGDQLKEMLLNNIFMVAQFETQKFFEHEDVAQQVFDAKRLELCAEIYKKLVASLQKMSGEQPV
jgi:hypothetical protein